MVNDLQENCPFATTLFRVAVSGEYNLQHKIHGQTKNFNGSYMLDQTTFLMDFRPYRSVRKLSKLLEAATSSKNLHMKLELPFMDTTWIFNRLTNVQVHFSRYINTTTSQLWASRSLVITHPQESIDVVEFSREKKTQGRRLKKVISVLL